mgnify:CR=1 FL=1
MDESKKGKLPMVANQLSASLQVWFSTSLTQLSNSNYLADKLADETTPVNFALEFGILRSYKILCVTNVMMIFVDS